MIRNVKRRDAILGWHFVGADRLLDAHHQDIDDEARAYRARRAESAAD